MQHQFLCSHMLIILDKVIPELEESERAVEEMITMKHL